MGGGEEDGVLGQKTSDFHYKFIYTIFNVIENILFWIYTKTKPKRFKYPESGMRVLLVEVKRLTYIILSFSEYNLRVLLLNFIWECEKFSLLSYYVFILRTKTHTRSFSLPGSLLKINVRLLIII